MSKCTKCNVQINTSIKYCPLCQNKLSKISKEEDIFPKIEHDYQKHQLVLNILFLCSIFSICLSTFLNYSLNNKITWAWFVSLAIICFWLTLVTALKRRKYFLKMMFAEIFLIVIISIIWDYFTGWYMWSLNYCLPFLCAIYTITMLIMRIFIKHNIRDNIYNISINATMGLVPGILLIFNVVSVKWPAYISVVLSLLIICFLLVFNRHQLKTELARRFHI